MMKKAIFFLSAVGAIATSQAVNALSKYRSPSRAWFQPVVLALRQFGSVFTMVASIPTTADSLPNPALN